MTTQLEKYPQHKKLAQLAEQKGIGGLVMEYGSIVCTGGQQLITEFQALLSELERYRGALEEIMGCTGDYVESNSEMRLVNEMYYLAQQALAPQLKESL